MHGKKKFNYDNFKKEAKAMKNRKNYLKARKKQFKWNLIGWHNTGSICPKCEKETVFHIYKYDAWCCTSCNEWWDDVCGDPDCPFCGKRPETPYEMYFLADMEANSVADRKYWRRKNYQHKTEGMKKHKRKKELYIKIQTNAR